MSKSHFIPGSAPAPESWLEVIDSDSPILLIAPHGGRAEARTRALMDPKVNDLHTAEITRGLAERLGASALINAAMDRNRLDCNRLAQIIEGAPWLLEIIAERVQGIVERHGRATVLLIHGWNLIEPRVDLGLGLRKVGGELRPPGAACVSASDQFINGPLLTLTERLRAHGIKPSYGMRYPGGGLQNLLQAFTSRHRESPVAALRAISEIAEGGMVDAAQLELSVALRMPGELRERCEESIAAAFSDGAVTSQTSDARAPIVVNRTPRPSVAARKSATNAVAAALGRVGIEFYDPAARIGALASFDVGGGVGARIMVLYEGRKAALYTAEGKSSQDAGGVALGPLALKRDGSAVVLSFRGPAVVVPDATAYLSVERALASGQLEGAMEVTVRFEIGGGEFEFERILSPSGSGGTSPAGSAAFGRATGAVSVAGIAQPLSGFARAGRSFLGLGVQPFTERKMIWACFDDRAAPLGLEVRSLAVDDAPVDESAGMLLADGWRTCRLRELRIDASAIEEAPGRVTASLARSDSASFDIEGRVECFLPLSRPGPGHSRIYTSLGFASFRSGALRGAGMFEYSQVTESVLTAGEDGDDSDTD